MKAHYSRSPKACKKFSLSLANQRHLGQPHPREPSINDEACIERKISTMVRQHGTVAALVDYVTIRARKDSPEMTHKHQLRQSVLSLLAHTQLLSPCLVNIIDSEQRLIRLHRPCFYFCAGDSYHPDTAETTYSLLRQGE